MISDVKALDRKVRDLTKVEMQSQVWSVEPEGIGHSFRLYTPYPLKERSLSGCSGWDSGHKVPQLCLYKLESCPVFLPVPVMPHPFWEQSREKLAFPFRHIVQD